MRHATPPEGVSPDLDASLDALLKLAFLDDPSGSLPLEPATDEGEVDGLPEFGHFRILRELGRGGMGVVYLAEDLRLHRNVAIKVLTAFAAHSPALRKRLLREAEAASKLEHPTICNVHEVGEANGQPFIAMQYIEGETLAKKIAERQAAGEVRTRAQSGSTTTARREEVLDAVKLVETVARALHAAHESGLVHRDIKPANIMVTTAGAPVLLDFGLARDVETDAATLTQTGQVMGTPGYMPPEQLRGERTAIDRRVDVYALGVTLYECLTMRRPFKAATREQLYAKILASDPPDPRRKNPAIPRDLRVVLDTALEKDPDCRYQSAEDLADDLRRVREQRPVRARPVSPAGRLIRWARRRPARAALVAVLVVGVPLLAGLLGYLAANLPGIEKLHRQEVEAKLERLLENGFDELAHGVPERAIAAFESALSARENNWEAVGGKALALLKTHRDQECLEFLNDRPELLAAQPIIRQLRADALENLGRKGPTDREEPIPRTTLGYFLAGMRLLQNCQTQYDPAVFREAASWFQRAVYNSKQARPLYYFQLAHVAGHLTHTNRTSAEPGAADDFCRMIADALQQQWRKSAMAWHWSAIALCNVDDQAAAAASRKAIYLDPDLAKAWNVLAGSLKRSGRYEEAIKAYERAAELSANDPYRAARGHIGLAHLYCEVGEYRDIPKAIHILEDARSLQPVDSVVLGCLGGAYIAGGRWSKAIDTYREIIKIAPKQAFAYSQLGMCLLRAGRFQESAVAFEKALEINEAHFQAIVCYVPYGQALMNAGRPAEAVTALEKAEALRPQNPEIRIQLGLANMRIQQWKNAARAFQDAIVRGRNRDPDIYCNLGLSLLRSGEFERAEQALQRGHDLGAQVNGWRFPSGWWLEECKQMRRLAPKLKSVLHGEEEPPPPDDECYLAGIAFIQRRFGASAALYEHAFERRPSLKNGREIMLSQTPRFAAACAAALAGCSRGIDASNFDAADRSHWREKAHMWLQEDLAMLEESSRPPSVPVSRRVASRLKSWKSGPLEVLRETAALRALPKDEYQAWTALWGIVDRCIRKHASASGENPEKAEKPPAKRSAHRNGY